MSDISVGQFLSGSTSSINKFSVGHSYEQNVWAYACIKAIASSMSSIPVLFIEDQKIITDKKHPLYTLFNPPSGQSIPSFNELINRSVIHQLVDGIVHWVVKKKAGVPYDLKLRKKQELRPIVDDASTLIGWALVSAKNVTIEYLRLGDVVTFSEYDPKSIISFLSPLRVSALDLEQDYNMSKWNSNFFKKGFDADIILQTDQPLMESQRKELVNSFVKGRSGVEGDRGVALLSHGLNIAQPLKRDKRESDFVDSKELPREGICAAFGVPPAMVGIFRYANYANTKEQEKIFWTKTIIPRHISMCELITAQLITPNFPDIVAKSDLRVARQYYTDYESLGKTVQTYLAAGYTKNQIALILDKPELAVDDEESPENSDSQESEPDDKKSLVSKSWDVQYSDGYNGVLRSIEERWSKLIKIYTDQMRVSSSRRVSNKLSPELSELVWVTRFTDLVTPVVTYMFEMGVSVFSDEEAASDVKSIPKFTLKKNYLDSLTPAEKDVITTALSIFIERCKSIGSSIVSDFNLKIIPLFYSGASISEIQREIQSLLGPETQSKALGLSRGISGAGYNTSRYLMMHMRGVERHRWVDSNDELVRETHESENGNEVDIGKPFPVTNLLYPHDPNGPWSEIANCRCTTAATVFNVKGRRTSPDMDIIKGIISDIGSNKTVERIESSEFFKDYFPEGTDLTSLSIIDLIAFEDWSREYSTVTSKATLNPTHFVTSDFKYSPLSSEDVKDISSQLVDGKKSALPIKEAIEVITANELSSNFATGEVLSVYNDNKKVLSSLGISPIVDISDVTSTVSGTTVGKYTESNMSNLIALSELSPVLAKEYKSSWAATINDLPDSGSHNSLASSLSLNPELISVKDISEDMYNSVKDKGSVIFQGYQTSTHADYKSVTGYRVLYTLPKTNDEWSDDVLVSVNRSGSGHLNIDSGFSREIEKLILRGFWSVSRFYEVDGVKYIVLRRVTVDEIYKVSLKSYNTPCYYLYSDLKSIKTYESVISGAVKYIRENLKETQATSSLNVFNARVFLFNKFIEGAR